ncbi:MAG: STAS domain-containing protein [Alphaproteobacteria bacterium]|jgi:anti-anti-sigma factor
MMQYVLRSTATEREFVLSGDFTSADEEKFFDVFLQVRRQPEPQVVFNLAECSFIDSAAMGMLVVACEEAAKRSVIRVIRAAPPEIKALLLSAQFDRLYHFQE